jgi:phospholipase/carboxylesterase
MPETEHTLTAEINLYYDVAIPDDIAAPAPLLIAVHGYGAHKRYMLREAKQIAPPNFVLASVQAPHQHFRRTDDGYRIGFGWLTDHKPDEYVALHHRFLLEVIARLAADNTIDRSQVYLYGFSQACALNFRFAFTYPDVLRAIIGVCGGVPGDLDTNPVYKSFDAETFYLFGDDDEFYSQERFAEFDKKLAARLPNYRSKHYTAKHEITGEMRDDIKAFLGNITERS